MYVPPPKPAPKARVWKSEVRIGRRWVPCWFGQRVGATSPMFYGTWQEAIDFAADWDGTWAFYQEERRPAPSCDVLIPAAFAVAA